MHGLWRDKANKDDGDDTDEPPTSPFSPHGNKDMTYPLFLDGIFFSVFRNRPVRNRSDFFVSPIVFLWPHVMRQHNYFLGDLAALGRPHKIGCEKNKQTKLTVEPGPKTKELRSIGVQLN